MADFRRQTDQKRPLAEIDSLDQTLGCRHSQPDICKNNSTPGKCAFVREDEICMMPPKSWPKLYKELGGK